MSAALPIAIQNYLRGFVARRRLTAIVMGLGCAVAFALTWILLACLADRFLQLRSWMRMGLLITGSVGVAAIFFLFLRRIVSRSFDWTWAAEAIEQRNPRFAQRLQTVVSQFGERQ